MTDTDGDGNGGGQEERTVLGFLRHIMAGITPYIQQQVEHTPTTGHWQKDVGKMWREIDNWPHAWMPEDSPARDRLKARIRDNPDDSYVYYPLGAHRPNIWDDGQRWTLGEYQERYGSGTEEGE